VDKTYLLIFKNDIKPLVNITRWMLIIIKVLLIPVLLIIRIPYFWLIAIILAVVSMLEYHALKLVPSVYFSSGSIIFKGIVNKKYSWSVFANIVLKDGLLTADFKDNRLFQKETDSAVNEQEFNDWCNRHLYGLKG